MRSIMKTSCGMAGKERGESGGDTELMWDVCVSVHGCVLVFGEGRGLR